MSLTASNIIQRVNRRIHNLKDKMGGDPEILSLMNEANRDMQLEAELISTQRPAPQFLAYSNVYEYPLPVDIAYDKAIDIKKSVDKKWSFEKADPSAFQNLRNTVSGLYNWSWSAGNNLSNNTLGVNSEEPRNVYAIDFQNTRPYLLLRGNVGNNQVTLSEATDLTSNGTWVASNDAANLRKDIQRNNISFDAIAGAGVITVSNSTINPVDLTSYVNLGRLFFEVALPATTPNSITVYWGSSITDYYEQNITIRQNGLPFIPGNNILGANWLGATVTGSPDDTAINYVAVDFNYTIPVAQTNFGIHNFFMGLGSSIDMNYYSKYTVQSVTGTFKEDFTSIDDLTLLQEEEVNMLVLKASMKAAQSIRELSGDYSIFMGEYNQMLQIYMFKHPSRKQLEMDSYYIL